jgi:hypothetical protein
MLDSKTAALEKELVVSFESDMDAPVEPPNGEQPSAPKQRAGSLLRWWGVLLMLLALGALVWAAWTYVVRPRVLRSALTQSRAVAGEPELRVAPRIMGK